MIAITECKGFHITFPNGWTASVQIGPGNYCSNRNEPWGQPPKPSGTAEVAAFKETEAGDEWFDFGEDKVKGWQSATDVLAFLNQIASLP